MFTHLHVRSWFSFLAGGSAPDDYINRAYEMGMKSLALTDLNGVYGVVRFQKVCREAGIKPIFGAEVSVLGTLYSVLGGRQSQTYGERPDTKHRAPSTGYRVPSTEYPTIVLLAANHDGYSNLCRILTESHLRDRDHPHALLEDLSTYSQDLFCLTGAQGSLLWSLLDDNRLESASIWVEQLKEIFGDRLSIEVAHHLLPGDNRRLQRLHALSLKTGVPMAASGDVRYAVSDHYRRYDLMTCIRNGITVFEPHPERPHNAEAYLKGEDSLRKLIPWSEAFDRAEEIAAACQVDLLPGYITPPAAQIDEGESCREKLIRLCREGLEERYGSVLGEEVLRTTYSLLRGRQADTIGAQLEAAGPSSPAPTAKRTSPSTEHGVPSTEHGVPSTGSPAAQMERELEVIFNLQLEEFFLVVHEIVSEARRRGIRCAGRGSAANSIVAYLLRITEVDPLKHRLLFERFLHGGRKGTPDIDVDFDSERREEVISWMEDRFGIEQTAMTATLVTYRLRSAVRDVAKALGWSMEDVDKMSKSVAPAGARHVREYRVNLEQAVRASPLLDLLIGMVESLADCPRHLGLHSGGMVLSREPLYKFSPVQVSANGVKMVQFDKYDVESLGLVKLDVLGLRMLASVSEAVELIQRNQDPDFRLEAIPFDDIPTFNMIRASETLGTFQIESQGQLHLLAQHQPENFDDLITEIALFRPGPLQGGMVHPFVRRRRGEEEVTYDHPDLEPILRDTYGIILFQEQVLEVAHRFAGMSLAEADDFRSLMSRFRDPGEMEQMREKFVRGAMRRGIDEPAANVVFDRVSNFVGYGFCRSHAAAFAKTVYESCYLKKHYPAAFMAAIMEHRPGMYNLMTIQEEARRFGVTTLPPDVNRSGMRYEIELVPGSRFQVPGFQPSTEYGAPNSEYVERSTEYVERSTEYVERSTEYDPEVPSTEYRVPSTEYRIRKPFTAVKELSEDDASLIVWERLQNGLFTSIEDFYRRVPLEEDALRSLARSGAFDEMAGDSRKALWEVGLLLRSPVPRGRRTAKELFVIQAFTEEDIPDLPELTAATRLSWDYETHGSSRAHPMTLMRRTLNELEIRSIETCYRFGRYVPVGGAAVSRWSKAGHEGIEHGIPVDRIGRQAAEARVIPKGTSHDLGPATPAHRSYPVVTVAGLSMLRQRPPTAKGVLFITLEDETGFIQCVVRPKVLEYLDHVLRHSSLIVRGELHIQGNWRGLVVTNAWPLNGIFGGYEGHPCQDAGRDRMIVRPSGDLLDAEISSGKKQSYDVI